MSDSDSSSSRDTTRNRVEPPPFWPARSVGVRGVSGKLISTTRSVLRDSDGGMVAATAAVVSNIGRPLDGCAFGQTDASPCDAPGSRLGRAVTVVGVIRRRSALAESLLFVEDDDDDDDDEGRGDSEGAGDDHDEE